MDQREVAVDVDGLNRRKLNNVSENGVDRKQSLGYITR